MDKVTDSTTGFHFTIVDNYILNKAGLNAMEQIVYVQLKQYSALTNKCFPGINKLAESLGSSSNTIRKTLRSLKAKRFIDIHQRFNDSNEYTLLPYPEYVNAEDNTSGMDRKEKGIGKVLKSYQDNINPVYGSMEREKLLEWYGTFGDNAEILIKAIELSVMHGVRKIKYIESILLNWHQYGARTMEQCEACQKEWEEKRRESRNGTGDIPKSQGGDSGERYDFSKYGDI